jgi:hypothetical protein
MAVCSTYQAVGYMDHQRLTEKANRPVPGLQVETLLRPGAYEVPISELPS